MTSGDDVADVARFLAPGADSYRAIHVIDYLLGNVDAFLAEAATEPVIST